MSPLEVKGFNLFEVGNSMMDAPCSVGSDGMHYIKTCLFPAS